MVTHGFIDLSRPVCSWLRSIAVKVGQPSPQRKGQAQASRDVTWGAVQLDRWWMTSAHREVLKT